MSGFAGAQITIYTQLLHVTSPSDPPSGTSGAPLALMLVPRREWFTIPI
jgi:hypothetical protein